MLEPPPPTHALSGSYLSHKIWLSTQSSANIKTVFNPRHFHLCAKSITVYHSALWLLPSALAAKTLLHPGAQFNQFSVQIYYKKMHQRFYVLNSQCSCGDISCYYPDGTTTRCKVHSLSGVRQLQEHIFCWLKHLKPWPPMGMLLKTSLYSPWSKTRWEIWGSPSVVSSDCYRTFCTRHRCRHTPMAVSCCDCLLTEQGKRMWQVWQHADWCAHTRILMLILADAESRAERGCSCLLNCFTAGRESSPRTMQQQPLLMCCSPRA